MSARSLGRVFNEIAADYDAHRPTYPDVLIDHASAVAGLAAGDRVVESGAGTGQLTASLVARGLAVTAVEPGEQLLGAARAKVPAASFVQATLEEAALPTGHFKAAFAASSIHWVDPDVGWSKLAAALVPGGTLALISFFPIAAEDDQADLHAVIEGAAPELPWPELRSLAELQRGVAERAANVSAAWSWLSNHELERAAAAELFGVAELMTVEVVFEQTAAQGVDVLSTFSWWSQLAPEQRAAIQAGLTALELRLGRPLRSTTVAALLSARRSPIS